MTLSTKLLLLCLASAGSSLDNLVKSTTTRTTLQPASTHAENDGNSSRDSFTTEVIRLTQYDGSRCDICLELMQRARKETDAIRQDSPFYCNSFDSFVRCAQSYGCRFSTGSREQVITERCAVLSVKKQSCVECQKLLQDAKRYYPNLDRDSVKYCEVMSVPFACFVSKNCHGDINKQSITRCKDKFQDCDHCSSLVDDAWRVSRNSGLHGLGQPCDKIAAALRCIEENKCGFSPRLLINMASERCPAPSTEAGALRVRASRPASLTLAFLAVGILSLTVRFLT